MDYVVVGRFHVKGMLLLRMVETWEGTVEGDKVAEGWHGYRKLRWFAEGKRYRYTCQRRKSKEPLETIQVILRKKFASKIFASNRRRS